MSDKYINIVKSEFLNLIEEIELKTGEIFLMLKEGL